MWVHIPHFDYFLVSGPERGQGGIRSESPGLSAAGYSYMLSKKHISSEPGLGMVKKLSSQGSA